MAAGLFSTLLGAGCIGSSGAPSKPVDDAALLARRRFPLDTLPTATVKVKDADFRAWLALTPDHREEGLMFVPESALADYEGMLFVFPEERELGFWMRNTVTSLDIAFARTDGTVVAIHTMPPLTLQTFPSIEPAAFALEVRAGTWSRIGLIVGDRLEIPADVFNSVR